MNPQELPAARVKCLVVDDVADNLFAMAALLQNDAVEVLTAQSGRQALELLLVNQFALALLDVQMPQMDGFELAELMRSSERTRQVPIIFLTAGTREPQRLFKGYEAGAVDFLFKPIEPWLLENKCRVFFDLYRSREQLARELRERTETLRLNELFAAVLAHDLRDPLNAMTNSAALLERTATTDMGRTAARRIGAAGHAMSRMIGDVLDLSRARLGGGLQMQPAATGLRPVLERVLDQQRTIHPDATITLDCEADLCGVWDADRLAQAVANLVGNALTHGTPNGAVQVDAAAAGAGQVRVSVSSDGEIAPELLAHVFDPFRSGAQTQAGRRDGLGLGLYIVEQIVLGHRGSVGVAAHHGRTVFHINLPCEVR